ncbi:MAG: UDP-N-acetylmuramoyl-tripeptide--D-alanyl-D-alanine ligase [Flavobacteriales bacterium]
MIERIFNQFLKVRKVTTDTRNIQPGDIFFALKGGNFNGNAFALKALEQGASMVVVDEPQDPVDPRMVLVDDALTALQQVAKLYRESLTIPFLAITGSNGKTTTKELIRDVLSKRYRVSATLGNLNNHIGVPLTLLAIPADCELAIVEMGANHQGEIRSYCQYALPSHALITNMGKAHLEGFGGEEGVVKGKKELYDFVSDAQGVIFVNTDLEKLRRASAGMNIQEYSCSTLECVSESPTLVYAHEHEGVRCEYLTQLAGAYNLYNIASAIAVGEHFDIPNEEIHAAICAYSPENNRSQVKHTERNTLILDAYNANPTSLEFALEALSKQSNEQKFFVIGDMLELGDMGPAEHRHIIEVAKRLGLKGILVGPIFRSVRNDGDFEVFDSNVAAKAYLEAAAIRNHVILIKGSRGIKLEEVVSAL